LTSRFRDLRGRTLWVLFGCLVCQLGLGFGYLTAPLLKDITADLEIPRAVFSTAGAARLWVVSLASPLLGIMVLRLGARPLLLAATLMLAPAFVWLATMRELWELYGANVLLGLVLVGFGDITLGAVVATWVVRGRGLALGLVYTGSNLAGALLPPLVTALAVRASWRQALLYVGVGGALFILPFAAGVVRERLGSDPNPISEDEITSAAARPGSGRVELDVRQALRTRSFWILGLALFGFFFYMLGVIEHLVASLDDAGLSRQAATGYFSFAIGMGLVSKVLMGAVADRISPRPAILIDYGLLALSSVLLLFVPARPFLQLFVVVFGFAYAARDVVYPLIIADCFGVRSLAPIYGALMVVLAPAGSLGGIFAGFVFDRFGSYDMAFQTYAVVNAVVFASLFLLRRERV
jgi:predicted MFS family arabinose efflux permease